MIAPGGIVIGMHNDTMVPLVNHATIGGVPVRHILDEATIEKIIQRTRIAGTAITQKLTEHSGFYAASPVVTQIVESIVFKRLGTFPLGVYCTGEYGYNDICLALPSVVGQDGINRVLEIDLDPGKRKALDNCASVISEVEKDIL